MKSIAVSLTAIVAMLASTQAADTVISLAVPQQLAAYPVAVSQLINALATQMAVAPKPLGEVQILPFAQKPYLHAPEQPPAQLPPRAPEQAPQPAPEQIPAPKQAPAPAPAPAPEQAPAPQPAPQKGPEAPQAAPQKGPEAPQAPRPAQEKPLEATQPAPQGPPERVLGQPPSVIAYTVRPVETRPAVLLPVSPLQTLNVIPSPVIGLTGTLKPGQEPTVLVASAPLTILGATGSLSKTLSAANNSSQSQNRTRTSTSRTTGTKSEASTESDGPTETAERSAAGRVSTGWAGIMIVAAMGGLLL